MFSGQTSKGTRCVNMQLFIFICLAYFYLSDACSQVGEGMLYRNRQLDHLKKILHPNRDTVNILFHRAHEQKE